MGDTNIEWTRNADGRVGKTWNPIRARNKKTGKPGWFCEHVSEGCRNCYAERMNRNTYFGNGLNYKPAALSEVELFLDEKILQQPLHWSKPQNVFPCSMTDLFGSWVKDEWILKILDVIRRTSFDGGQNCGRLRGEHTYQILTKRPERAAKFLPRLRFNSRPKEGQTALCLDDTNVRPVVLKNLWLGVSCEDQKTADERIPLLLQTPAAVRWISAEPLLGPVDLRNLKDGTFNALDGIDYEDIGDIRGAGVFGKGQPERGLDWVVVGSESGPKARPMHPDWARSLRDQCVAAGVPFFFKQWGEWAEGVVGDILVGEPETRLLPPDHHVVVRAGKKAAGRILDGREWNEYPKAKAIAAV